MRTIKFRAFVKKEHGDENFPTGMHEWEDVKGWVYLWDMVKEGTIELLQFTGLTDKNGKEIYEGDVVSDTGCGCIRYRIGFDRGFFSMVGVNPPHYDRIGIWNVYKGLEVIGNIQENPELLDVGLDKSK